MQPSARREGFTTIPNSTQYRFGLYDDGQNLLVDMGSQVLAPASGGLVEIQRTLSTDDVVDGPALFGITRVGTVSGFVNAYFGYVELQYAARYVATGDRLRFGLPETAGDYDLEVQDFTTDDLLLFDVSDAGAPRTGVVARFTQ